MVQPVRSILHAGWTCLFRNRHLGKVEKVIPDQAYSDAFNGSHADQLDQDKPQEACATSAFRIGDIGKPAACRPGYLFFDANTRFGPMSTDKSLNLSTEKAA